MVMGRIMNCQPLFVCRLVDIGQQESHTSAICQAFSLVPNIESVGDWDKHSLIPLRTEQMSEAKFA